MLAVHAYIEVTTAEQGIVFYCDGLGLRVKRRLSPRWIELEGASLPIFLLAGRSEIADLGNVTARRDYGRHWTPVHLDFVVENIVATVDRLIALGGTLDRDIAQREYGRIANMADPFGNGLDLIEFSGPGYDNLHRA